MTGRLDQVSDSPKLVFDQVGGHARHFYDGGLVYLLSMLVDARKTESCVVLPALLLE